MLKLIFKLCKKRFIKYLHAEGGTNITLKNLSYAFHDLDGNAYYRYSKEVDLPIVRTGKIHEFMMWLTKGISKEEYLKVIEVAETALVDGITNKKGVSKIGFALHQLKDRCNMVLHDDLFYNMIACQLIRADESPAEFNNEIHMQKVVALKEMDLISNDAFFLVIRELIAPLGLSSITRNQLEALLSESAVVREATERMLKSL